MNWLVFHIISGQAFFTGAALVIGAALTSLSSPPIFKRLTIVLFVVGIFAIVLSSTAIPYWYYALVIVVMLVWIASRFKPQWRSGASIAVIVAWLVAALIELPYHVTRSLLPASHRSITIIGDSITAGVDDGSETWPNLLAGQHGLEVQDISHMGETAASALKRVKTHQIDSPVVIVEIGGNDLLGSTTTAKFAHDLEALITHLKEPGRQILMFELPLPPLCHEYGRIQRTIAKRHDVTLVPKRVLLSVIAGSESTLDTIHLTQSGHQLMADRVWHLVKSAFSQ